jgi:hypothetical protein
MIADRSVYETSLCTVGIGESVVIRNTPPSWATSSPKTAPGRRGHRVALPRLMAWAMVMVTGMGRGAYSPSGMPVAAR